MSSEQFAQVGDVQIAYETMGDPSDPPMLLVMGLGMQLIHWPDELCAKLVERGFFLIRFDNRDAGHSTQIDAPAPNLRRAFAGLRIESAYKLRHMAGDAFGLMDHLGVQAAHLVGVSMGGMIAQQMAIEHPERVLSLASIMSTTGERRVGRPKLRLWALMTRPAPRERDAYIEYFVRLFRAIGSSKRYPANESMIREEAARTYDRGYHPAGTSRQLGAIIASGDRTDRLRDVRVPTVVVHGRSDPLVPFRGGAATARAIPDARLVAIDGMGHDLPPEVWPTIVDAVVENAARAAAPVA
ncbi:MAG TPA: alpha/beta fold hydrolase [Thermoleophilaceae bacterium]|jgi:pimeloyl-ACP methyl ester carboxylesterase